MIPQAGSAYAYSYATLGEIVAWIIGWDLILEYAVGNVAVAIAWSGLLHVASQRVRHHAPGVDGHGYRDGAARELRIPTVQRADADARRTWSAFRC